MYSHVTKPYENQKLINILILWLGLVIKENNLMKYLYLTLVRKYCNVSGNISSDDFFLSILIHAYIMFKICSYVTIQNYMKAKKFTILPHNSVFPDLATCGFFSPNLKKTLRNLICKSQQALDLDICQWLGDLPKSAHRDIFQKWLQRFKLCISNPS